MKSSYSFEDRGTDRQTDRRNRFRNVLSKTFRMIYDTPTKLKISWRRGKQYIYTSPITLGGGIIKRLNASNKL